MNRARPEKNTRSIFGERPRCMYPRRVTRHRVHDEKIAIKREPIVVVDGDDDDDDYEVITVRYALSLARFAKIIIGVLDLQG